MDYTELTERLEATVEDSFSAEDLAFMTQQAEEFIYNTVQFPDLRKSGTATTAPSTATAVLPNDFLFPYNLLVVDGDGNYLNSLNKDVTFIREAYPNPTYTAIPKHYALLTKDTIILGPTPDASYTINIDYGYYPESIVTAGNTWLGDNFATALFNCVVYEAARFMKAEQDMVAMYKAMRDESVMLLKALGDGKLRQDAYRSGQVRTQVV